LPAPPYTPLFTFLLHFSRPSFRYMPL
jgi:hypothetical protein